MISIFLCVQTAFAQQSAVIPADSTKKKKVESENEAFEAPEPETKQTSNTWLIAGGVAVVAIGAAALAGGGGGGGSGSSDDAGSADSAAGSENTEDQYNEYIGPNLSGSGWSGTVTLNNEDYVGDAGEVMQSVTATVYQEDANVTISISSSLPYATSFVGKISDGGYMVMVDQVTGKTWTTVSEVSTGNVIHLYDLVNDNRTYDIVYLTR